MANNQWTVETLKATADIGGTTVDLASLVLDFGLNEIPQATLMPAVGRDATSLVPAELYNILDNTKPRTPVKVFLTAKVTDGNNYDPQFSGTSQKIFDGYITSVGYRKIFGRADFTITASHWLIDLALSSPLSAQFSAANPYHMSCAAALPAGLSAGAAKADSLLVTAQATLSSASVTQDFWAALKQMFVQLTTTAFFDWGVVRAPLNLTCASGSSVNAKAAAALNKFEPVYKYGAALGLGGALNASQAAANIANQVLSQTNSDLAATSIWDKLVGDIAPTFLLAIVPRVDSAIVIPFTPGLRPGAASPTIKADEIDQFESYLTMPRPIRGVILMMDRAFMAGVIPANVNPLNVGGSQGQQCAGAIYDSCQEGVFICKSAPPWVANTILPVAPPQTTLQTPRNTNQNPQPASPPPPQNADIQLWQNYAQALYLQEVLRYRQARIGGKLRLDIAPGSVVTIEAPDDRFIAPGHNLFGTVLRTTITIDAEGCRAGTAFQVACVRDQTENQDPNFSTGKHPIWNTPFHGAPLI